MKTQDTISQYELNESLSLMATLQRVEKSPLADRNQGKDEYRTMMIAAPEIIKERIQWIIDGNYGYGAMKSAERSIQSRGNKIAQLAILVAALEYGCPSRMAAEAFNSLSKDQQKAINAAISELIS